MTKRIIMATRISRIILSVLAVIALSGPVCQQNSRSLKMGVAGVWPPGASLGIDGSLQSTPEAWSALVTGIRARADHWGLHADHKQIAAQISSFSKANSIPAAVVTELDPASLVDSCVQCLDAKNRSLSACTEECKTTVLPEYVASIQAAVKDATVRYWCVGNEVESLNELKSLSVYADTLFSEIKAASPMTATCVVFQYERALKLTNSAERASWFKRADILAVTSYPGVAMSQQIPGYTSATAIPSTYYAPLASWATGTGKKFAFTEVGWEAKTDTDHQKFYERLFKELLPAGTVFVNQFMLYDPVSPAVPAPFQKMGLCRPDQTCRPADQIWTGIFKLPYQG